MLGGTSSSHIHLPSASPWHAWTGVHRRDEPPPPRSEPADDPLSTGVVNARRRTLGSSEPLDPSVIPTRGWSVYGAKRTQPLATGGKGRRLEKASNKPKPLPSVATSCRGDRMVRRGSTVRVRQRASLFSLLARRFCFQQWTADRRFDVHAASTSVHGSNSGAFSASRSLIACSRPARARWP